MTVNIRKIGESDFPTLNLLFKEFALFEKLPEKMTNSVEQMLAEKEYLNGFVAVNSQNEIVVYVTCFFCLLYMDW